MNEFSEDIRSILQESGVVEDPSMMTSYSLRRVLATWADIRAIEDEERLLVQWQERAGQKKVSWMPQRYAADRACGSEVARLVQVRILALVLKNCEGEATWMKVRVSFLLEDICTLLVPSDIMPHMSYVSQRAARTA